MLSMAAAFFVPLAELWARGHSHWSVPAEEKARPNPTPASAESVARGKTLYGKNCQSCHGDKGDGKGPVAQRLGFEAGDLTNAKEMSGETDGELAWKIATGMDPMPAFKKDKNLTDAEIWDLVNYSRTLSAGTAQSQPAKP